MLIHGRISQCPLNKVLCPKYGTHLLLPDIREKLTKPCTWRNAYNFGEANKDKVSASFLC